MTKYPCTEVSLPAHPFMCHSSVPIGKRRNWKGSLTKHSGEEADELGSEKLQKLERSSNSGRDSSNASKQDPRRDVDDVDADDGTFSSAFRIAISRIFSSFTAFRPFLKDFNYLTSTSNTWMACSLRPRNACCDFRFCARRLFHQVRLNNWNRNLNSGSLPLSLWD